MPCFVAGSHHCQDERSCCPSRVLFGGALGLLKHRHLCQRHLKWQQQPEATLSQAEAAQHVRQNQEAVKGSHRRTFGSDAAEAFGWQARAKRSPQSSRE